MSCTVERILGGVLVFDSCEEMNCIQWDIAERIFSLNVAGISDDSNRHTLPILSDLGGGHTCHVATQVCAADCGGIAGGDDVGQEPFEVVMGVDLFGVARDVRVGRQGIRVGFGDHF